MALIGWLATVVVGVAILTGIFIVVTASWTSTATAGCGRCKPTLARYRIDPGRFRVAIEARRASTPSTPRPPGSRDGWSSKWTTAAWSRRGACGCSPGAPGRTAASGNPLEDRELRRRIDARRYPTICGDLTPCSRPARTGWYLVEGDLTFKGVTRRYEDEMTLEAVDGEMVIRPERSPST